METLKIGLAALVLGAPLAYVGSLVDTDPARDLGSLVIVGDPYSSPRRCTLLVEPEVFPDLHGSPDLPWRWSAACTALATGGI